MQRSYFLEAQDLLLEETGHLMTDTMCPHSPSNPHIRELGHFKTGKREADLGIASMTSRTYGKGMGLELDTFILKQSQLCFVNLGTFLFLFAICKMGIIVPCAQGC